MKAILFASARIAATTDAALAGKSGHDAFAQTLSGPLRTYVAGRGAALARSDMPIPVDARLPPSSATMAGRETSNSLPAASVARGVAQGQDGQAGFGNKRAGCRAGRPSVLAGRVLDGCSMQQT